MRQVYARLIYCVGIDTRFPSFASLSSAPVCLSYTKANGITSCEGLFR
jgi:hypothetical protein